MPIVSKLFIAASIIYLLIGTALGFIMAYKSGKWVLRTMPTHAHFNLAGWVSMLVFGFVYFFLPMAAGKALYSSTLPYIHFVLGNAGLLGMGAVFFFSRFPKSPVSPRLVWPFGAMLVASVWLFAFNVLMTLFA